MTIAPEILTILQDGINIPCPQDNCPYVTPQSVSAGVSAHHLMNHLGMRHGAVTTYHDCRSLIIRYAQTIHSLRTTEGK